MSLQDNDPDAALEWLFSNGEDVGEDEEMAGESTSSESQAQPNVGGFSELPAKYKLKAFISHKGPSVHSGCVSIMALLFLLIWSDVIRGLPWRSVTTSQVSCSLLFRVPSPIASSSARRLTLPSTRF